MVKIMDEKQFFAETAARLLCVFLGPSWGAMTKEAAAKKAIEYTDEFVTQLKLR
jgi:hypothetical protein